MRIEGIALENHCDIAVLWGYVVHEPVSYSKLSAAYGLESGYHPQSGRFSASGRPYQDYEFPVIYLKVEVAHGGHIARIYLVYVLKTYICHIYLLSPVFF